MFNCLYDIDMLYDMQEYSCLVMYDVLSNQKVFKNKPLYMNLKNYSLQLELSFVSIDLIFTDNKSNDPCLSDIYFF